MIKCLHKKVRRNTTILIVIVLQFCCSFLFAQTGSTVEGKVLEEGGAPLPGVNVIVKGTSVGTTTDAHGGFRAFCSQPGCRARFFFHRLQIARSSGWLTINF